MRKNSSLSYARATLAFSIQRDPKSAAEVCIIQRGAAALFIDRGLQWGWGGVMGRKVIERLLAEIGLIRKVRSGTFFNLESEILFPRGWILLDEVVERVPCHGNFCCDWRDVFSLLARS